MNIERLTKKMDVLFAQKGLKNKFKKWLTKNKCNSYLFKTKRLMGRLYCIDKKPKTVIACESGSYLSYYNNRPDIIANGRNEIEVKRNLKYLYKIVIEHEKLHPVIT